MKLPRFILVRRPSNASFGVLPEDLKSETPAGYDLNLMRDIACNGLDRPIEVQPGDDGDFEVVDGQKRMAVIHLLIRANKLVYDRCQKIFRPASLVFALVRCRIGSRIGSSRRDGLVDSLRISGEDPSCPSETDSV